MVLNVEKTFNDWKKKRKITTYLAMFHACIVGIEYSSVTISAIFYLNNILHTDHANLFYSLTIGSMFTSSIIASIVLGRYMDKMRNARRIIFFTGILGIIGNLLYSLPYSPWLLVIGRFLCGFTDATFPVMIGEFTRCYHEQEFRKILTKYQFIYVCSFAIGPCTPILLQGLHYNHWPVIIDQSNAIGILLMFIQLVFTIIAYFQFSNLSEEDGYEQFLQWKEQKETENFVTKNDVDHGEEKNVSHEEMEERAPLKLKSSPITIGDMFTNFDVTIVTFGSSYSCFLGSMLDLVINMVCVYALNWTLTEVSIALFVGLFLNSMATFVVYKLLRNRLNIYFTFCMALIMPWVCMSSLIILDGKYIENFDLQMFCVMLIVMLNLMYAGFTSTCGRLMLFSLIPSHSSSACEGVRSSATRIFAGIAFYMAAFIYTYLSYCFFLFVFIGVVTFFCFLLRKQSFIC